MFGAARMFAVCLGAAVLAACTLHSFLGMGPAETGLDWIPGITVLARNSELAAVAGGVLVAGALIAPYGRNRAPHDWR